VWIFECHVKQEDGASNSLDAHIMRHYTTQRRGDLELQGDQEAAIGTRLTNVGISGAGAATAPAPPPDKLDGVSSGLRKLAPREMAHLLSASGRELYVEGFKDDDRGFLLKEAFLDKPSL
jgi:hypothetical protein